jgi:hypothetical protein
MAFTLALFAAAAAVSASPWLTRYAAGLHPATFHITGCTLHQEVSLFLSYGHLQALTSAERHGWRASQRLGRTAHTHQSS